MPPIRNYQNRPSNETVHRHYPHPAGGRGFWYALEMHEAAIHARDNGQHRDPVLLSLRQSGLWPCRQTINRWRRRRQTEGHFTPYRRTGNKRTTVLQGIEAIQLSWLMAVFPRINAHEINVFLYHANGQVRFYHPLQIYRAQDRIGLS